MRSNRSPHRLERMAFADVGRDGHQMTRDANRSALCPGTLSGRMFEPAVRATSPDGVSAGAREA
ncbi:hypothetical protein KIPE111705_23140 [Kibdelosporangium persicum]